MSDPYQDYDEDGTLILNGVSPNDNGEYYRAGFDPYGRPIDPTGNSFNPWAGSEEPTEGRCNSTLNKWEIRYGKRRYCGSWPSKETGVCKNHQNRITEENAKEYQMKASHVVEHGLFSRSLENFYSHIEPDRQIYVWGLFDDLIDDSIFDFQCEYREITIDCSDTDAVPDEFKDEDGLVELEVPNPSEHRDRAMSLWLAAIDRVKMINANAQILSEGVGIPKTVAAGMTEFGEEWRIEEEQEHHLNLPYSRLTRDIQEMLEYGGVGVDEAEDDMPSQVVEIYESPLDAGTDDAFTFDRAMEITQ